MNSLFGEVTGEYLQDSLDSGSRLFEHEGKYYDYGLSMTDYHFTVYDTVGRSVPIGIDEFEEFYRAVKLARNYANAIVKYTNAVDKRDHVIDLVNSDETLVCD